MNLTHVQLSTQFLCLQRTLRKDTTNLLDVSKSVAEGDTYTVSSSWSNVSTMSAVFSNSSINFTYLLTERGLLHYSWRTNGSCIFWKAPSVLSHLISIQESLWSVYPTKEAHPPRTTSKEGVPKISSMICEPGYLVGGGFNLRPCVRISSCNPIISIVCKNYPSFLFGNDSLASMSKSILSSFSIQSLNIDDNSSSFFLMGSLETFFIVYCCRCCWYTIHDPMFAYIRYT